MNKRQVKNLRTVDDRLFETYKEDCHLRALLENDYQWEKTQEKAAATRSPEMLRNLFPVMFLLCKIPNSLQVWDNHKESLESVLHQVQREQNNADLGYNQSIFIKARIMIENKIQSLDGCKLLTHG